MPIAGKLPSNIWNFFKIAALKGSQQVLGDNAMKRTFLSACAAALACLASMGSAQSAPLGAFHSAVNFGMTNGGTQNVHYRETRHCHWRDGERHCHGGDRDSYYDYDGGGIVLNLGGRHRHHRDWDRGDYHGNEGRNFRHHHRRVF